MKKIALSLAGVLAATVFSPEASAIPAFARQVGMACSACHYQHFPVLNSFGRAFKQGGYTLVGSQEKIEGDGVSLPATLNAALVGYVSYQKTNGPATATPTGKNSNDGQLMVPQQVSLFAGGRAGEHIGFEAEVNMANAGLTAGTQQSGLIRLKIPFVYDVGSVKVGVIPFSTGLGPADSFELLNTGAVAVHAFNQSNMSAVSAQQYIGTGAVGAAGVAFVASNDSFFANVAKWGANGGAGTSGGPTSNYLRAAWTPGDLIPGFDFAVGGQVWSGSSAETAPTVNPINGVVDTKASAIDAQLMGDVGNGMPLLVVASWAKAPATTAANLAAGTSINRFNTNSSDRKSFNVGAELGLIPNKATVQLGFRRANSGAVVPGTAAGNASDNAYLLGATYAIALNARMELTYVKSSGDAYNAAAKAAAGYTGDTFTMLDLAFGF